MICTADRVWWRIALLVFLGVSVLSAAGCEDEEPEVESALSGDGTIESPYLIQHGESYSDIPISPAGTVFFVAEDVPAGASEISTASTVDVDLGVFGFKNLFGTEGAGGSFTKGTGTEHFTALSDGEHPDLYFMVDGSNVRVGGATFNVSVLTSPSPTVTRTLCGFCNDFLFVDEFNFLLPEGGALAISLDNPDGNFMWVQAQDEFFTMSPIGTSGFGQDYCTVGYDETLHSPFVGPSTPNGETCQVQPVPGYDPLRELVLFNNDGFDGDIVITFSSP